MNNNGKSNGGVNDNARFLHALQGGVSSGLKMKYPTYNENDAVHDVIRKVLMADINPDVKIKDQVKSRQKEIRERIGKFDRNEYRKILNKEIRETFYQLVDGNETRDDVNLLKTVEFGTKQWSDDSLNFLKKGSLCSNACLYCYVQQIFNKNGQANIKEFYDNLMDNLQLQIIGECGTGGDERRARRPAFDLDQEKIYQKFGKRGMRKLFMTPTSHDIFPESVKDMIIPWKNALESGNSLLIVSKPSLECVKYICHELDGYKDRVTFRFTITTDQQWIADIFEPLAPTIDERLACLQHARDAGYETSVSIEPFLSDPVATVKKVLPFTTGEIWIGSMNSFPSKKIIGRDFVERETTMIENLKKVEYTFENHERIVSILRGNRQVHWKESFIKLYLKHRGY